MKIEYTITGNDDTVRLEKYVKEIVASLTEHMYIYAPLDTSDISTPNTPVVVNQNCHERPI